MNTFFSSSIEPDTLLPLTSDVVFKEVLGQEESKPILMGFLNDILDMNITSPDQITLLNPELNPEYIDDKLSILDIRVQLQDHTSIDVEIQVIDRTILSLVLCTMSVAYVQTNFKKGMIIHNFVQQSD